MTVSVLGIDLGKNICSIVGLDASGAVILRRPQQASMATMQGESFAAKPISVSLLARRSLSRPDIRGSRT
jgi:hypothetical protein